MMGSGTAGATADRTASADCRADGARRASSTSGAGGSATGGGGPISRGGVACMEGAGVAGGLVVGQRHGGQEGPDRSVSACASNVGASSGVSSSKASATSS